MARERYLVRRPGLGEATGRCDIGSRKRSVIRLILTATASQHLAVQDDFRDFVHTVRPGAGAASS
ncbi:MULTISPECIES: hypothetical protein [Streptomyces]|uniref:hypothetical protein n=1 Tax=Streptomyces TaxID=1883 RepID=UPI0033ABF6DD